MNLTTVVLAAAAMMAATGVQAQTSATLYDQTNIPDQGTEDGTGGTPISILFRALTNETSLSFAGYNVPSETNVLNASVMNGMSGSNLLSGSYTFTPAASGSLAFQSGNNLYFEGTTEGSYDTYTTNFASTVGSLYDLTFNLASYGGGEANGLRITATNVTPGNVGAVPEPATWAMMMVGFGMIGFGLRRRAKVATSVRFA